jgi:RES domain-containing protein
LSTLIWRIARRKYLDTSFSGIGASKVGGRWNSKGKSVVYCSATLSLAALEKFVHMELRHMSKQNLICFNAEIPDLCAIQTLEVS